MRTVNQTLLARLWAAQALLSSTRSQCSPLQRGWELLRNMLPGVELRRQLRGSGRNCGDKGSIIQTTAHRWYLLAALAQIPEAAAPSGGHCWHGNGSGPRRVHSYFALAAALALAMAGGLRAPHF